MEHLFTLYGSYVLQTCLILSCMGLLSFPSIDACTSILITSNATHNGHSFVTYNADESTSYGSLNFIPSATYPQGSYLDIFDGETGEHTGRIPQAEHTYNVVHTVNEMGVGIGESTWFGLPQLNTPYPGSILDYMSLMTIALQRADNAVEAAGVITGLADLYGWRSQGESFSIVDEHMAVLLEVVGKGLYSKGVVWAMQIIPNGAVTAHANQARIRQCIFPECILPPETLSFARSQGYVGTDQDFSFSDFFQPVTALSARVCEARVWSLFQKVTQGKMDAYLDYARGFNLKNRMPLYVTPAVLLTREMIFELMRDTYDNTFFAFRDTDKYLGAGPYSAPYRARPLTFQVDGKTYVNERAVATQQTLSNPIVEIRGTMNIPLAYKAVIWFGVDDTLHTVRFPLYGIVKDIPDSFANKSGGVLNFNLHSAFWIFNMVANLAYTSFEYISPEIQQAIQNLDRIHLQKLNAMDTKILSNPSSPTLIDELTQEIIDMGNNVTQEWWRLWQYLFMKYKDSYIVTKENGKVVSHSQEVPASWAARVVKESGTHFLIPTETKEESNVFVGRNDI